MAFGCFRVKRNENGVISSDIWGSQARTRVTAAKSWSRRWPAVGIFAVDSSPGRWGDLGIESIKPSPGGSRQELVEALADGGQAYFPLAC